MLKNCQGTRGGSWAISVGVSGLTASFPISTVQSLKPPDDMRNSTVKPQKRNKTDLSKPIWSPKRPQKLFCIRCRVRMCQLHNNVSKKCNLCLQEKHFLIFRKDLSSFNKRNKLASLLSGSFK